MLSNAPIAKGLINQMCKILNTKNVLASAHKTEVTTQKRSG